jgi:acetyl esterase/lipase
MPKFLSLPPLVALALLAGALGVSGVAKEAESSDPASVQHLDVCFAKTPQRDLLLDLFLPPNPKNPPLVIYIHGGGWRAGTRKSGYPPSLASEGFAVASIEYRYSTEAIFPAQIHDCKAAIRWLRANAVKYGYNADRIGVIGISAGGHLAALLGTSAGVAELEGDLGDYRDQSSRVDAVVDLFGATDFALRVATQPDKTEPPDSIVHLLFGGPASKKPELVRLASSVSFISPDDPPMLVFHGDSDSQVLINQSERIVSAYKDAGLSIEFHTKPGVGHTAEAFMVGESRQRIVEFLKKHLNAAAKITAAP